MTIVNNIQGYLYDIKTKHSYWFLGEDDWITFNQFYLTLNQTYKSIEYLNEISSQLKSNFRDQKNN